MVRQERDGARAVAPSGCRELYLWGDSSADTLKREVSGRVGTVLKSKQGYVNCGPVPMVNDLEHRGSLAEFE